MKSKLFLTLSLCFIILGLASCNNIRFSNQFNNSSNSILLEANSTIETDKIYVIPEYPIVDNNYTKKLTEAEVELFNKQAEILSYHLTTHVSDVKDFFSNSRYYEGQTQTLLSKDISNYSVLEFILSLYFFDDRTHTHTSNLELEIEHHPYYNFLDENMGAYENDAQRIASEFFGKKDWSVVEEISGNEYDLFAWYQPEKKYYKRYAGNIPYIQYELNNFSVKFLFEDNLIKVNGDLMFAYEFDAKFEIEKNIPNAELFKNSKAIFTYKVITNKESNHTFLRLQNIQFTAKY